MDRLAGIPLFTADPWCSGRHDWALPKLDKLGVTGSSPVPPIEKRPGFTGLSLLVRFLSGEPWRLWSEVGQILVSGQRKSHVAACSAAVAEHALEDVPESLVGVDAERKGVFVSLTERVSSSFQSCRAPSSNSVDHLVGRSDRDLGARPRAKASPRDPNSPATGGSRSASSRQAG